MERIRKAEIGGMKGKPLRGTRDVKIFLIAMELSAKLQNFAESNEKGNSSIFRGNTVGLATSLRGRRVFLPLFVELLRESYEDLVEGEF